MVIKNTIEVEVLTQKVIHIFLFVTIYNLEFFSLQGSHLKEIKTAFQDYGYDLHTEFKLQILPCENMIWKRKCNGVY